ncbi:MAG: polymer-forming cytoskeletal protein [Coprobacillus sp.]
MKLDKNESIKEKLLDRYFEDSDSGVETVSESDYQTKNDFTYETASVMSEVSVVKEPTVISAETVIHGNLNAKNDLEISGQVIGDIMTDGLIKIIGGSVTGNIKAMKIFVKGSVINGNLDSATMIDVVEDSEINGNINGGDIVIDCKCRGNVVAAERLRLMEKAVMKGDIQTKLIKIEEGAILEGNFKMTL